MNKNILFNINIMYSIINILLYLNIIKMFSFVNYAKDDYLAVITLAFSVTDWSEIIQTY